MRNYVESKDLSNWIKAGLQLCNQGINKGKYPEQEYRLFCNLTELYLQKSDVKEYPKVLAIYRHLKKLIDKQLNGDNGKLHWLDKQIRLVEERLKKVKKESDKQDMVKSEADYAGSMLKITAMPHNQRNYTALIQATEKLGDIYFQNSNYIYANGLYQFAVNVLTNIYPNISDINTNEAATLLRLKNDKIPNVEKMLLDRIAEEMGQDIKHFNQYATVNEKHKQTLKKIRDDAKEALKRVNSEYNYDRKLTHEMLSKKARKIYLIYNKISNDLKSFFCQIIYEAHETLGINKYQYVVLALGSLVRREATPYSDFEWLIVHKDMGDEQNKKAKIYLRNLADLVHNKLLNLGETILPTLDIPLLNNFYDDITKRGISFDGQMFNACKTPRGRQNKAGFKNYELIGTASELASLLTDKDLRNDGSHLRGILSDVGYLFGDEKLVQPFNEAVNKVLTQQVNQGISLRKQSGYMTLVEDHGNFDPAIIDEDSLGKPFVVKKEIYRLLDRTVATFAMYLGINASGAYDCLEKMSPHIFNMIAKENLQIAHAIAMEIRLNSYLIYDGQNDNLGVFYSVPEDQKDKEKAYKDMLQISNIDILLQYYRRVLPFYENISIILKSARNQELDFSSLKNNDFYDESPLTTGHIYNRLLQYEKAISFYMGDINNPNVIKYLVYTLGKNEYCLKIRDVVKQSKVLAGDHLDKALRLRNSSIINMHEGNWESAFDCIMESLEELILHNPSKLNNIIYSDLLMKFATIKVLIKLNACYTRIASLNKEFASNSYKIINEIKRGLYDNEVNIELAKTIREIGNIILKTFPFQSVEFYLIGLAILRRLRSKEYYIAEQLSDLSMGYLNVANVSTNILDEKDYLNKAKERCEEAIAVLRKYLRGQPHPRLGLFLGNLGLIYERIGEQNEAIQFHKQALDMNERVYGHNSAHTDIARSAYNLGCAYFELNRIFYYLPMVAAFKRYLECRDDDKEGVGRKTIIYQW